MRSIVPPKALRWVRCGVWVSIVLAVSAESWADGCKMLRQVSIPNTSIEQASIVKGPIDYVSSASLPSAGPIEVEQFFCRVLGTLSPAATSAIKFELWMPQTGWNGRYLQVGNGGLAGFIPVSFLAEGVAEGYAVAGTDDGTAQEGDPNTWRHEWLRDPERVADYGYRAVHKTATTAKVLVEAYYGKPPSYSYFSGSSKGGQEALMEAQRFPNDFDGILADMPAFAFSRFILSMLWNSQAMLKTPENMLSKEQLQWVHDAVLENCRDVAGLPGDDFLTDPRLCRFDPRSLLCSPERHSDCLSSAQVETVEAFYAGPRNPRTGVRIYPGLVPGSEAPDLEAAPGIHLHGWLGFRDYWLKAFPIPVIGHVLSWPDWDGRQFDFDLDAELFVKKLSPLTDATNPDLEPFRRRGGKLIMTQGWHDPLIAPMEAIRYYEDVISHQAAANGLASNEALQRTQTFFRLFMVPGQGHTPRSGMGPIPHHPLQQLVRWVEESIAPDMLPTEYAGANRMVRGLSDSRPLCAYPEIPGATQDGYKCVPGVMPTNFTSGTKHIK